MACWHPAIGCCESCLRQDTGVVPPVMPWESSQGFWPQRLLATLATAFRPGKTALGFVGGTQQAAWRFALLTALPLSLLRGIIPWTQQLRFGPSWRITWSEPLTQSAIAVDVLRAMGISFLLSMVYLAALALPYVSLCRSYGLPQASAAARRFVLYRAWLLPLAMRGLIFQLCAWGLPVQNDAAWLALLSLLDIVPLLFFASGMRATARIACGLGPWPAVAAVLVPLTLLLVSEGIVISLLLKALGIELPVQASGERLLG